MTTVDVRAGSSPEHENPAEDEDTATPEELAAAAVTLARRFAAGATMWCTAPEWPAHGRHVAVEFVHPVIVGKRALPVVDVEGADLPGLLRVLTRPGDVLLVVGSAADRRGAEVLLRARAWGLTTLWMGVGPRPAGGGAGGADVDHVIWSAGGSADRAARSGDLVVLYHLLWELTHVVFEHPGLLTAATAEPACTDEVCITCSDQGRVAEVQAVAGGSGPGDRAEVIVEGRTGAVDVSLLDGVGPGDLVLVHAGVAVAPLPLPSPLPVAEVGHDR